MQPCLKTERAGEPATGKDNSTNGLCPGFMWNREKEGCTRQDSSQECSASLQGRSGWTEYPTRVLKDDYMLSINHEVGV